MIPVSDTVIVGNELAYLKECVDTRWVSSLGPFVKKFEDSFAQYCGVKFASSVSNGTAALHAALLAAGIGKGDEVIVPDMTFVSTANAAVFCGAKPVFADVDRKSWNIGPEKIREKITPKTKAIIPVHLYGCPAEMDKINRIAKERSLFVLEDAAEAHGAEFKGKKCGSLSDASVFSFYGNKLITTGEGGMVLSNDRKFIEKVNILKDQGKSKTRKFYHDVLGYNFRFTNLQAAFGLAQLEGIDALLERKREIAKHYIDILSGTDGISFQEIPAGAKSAWWFFSIVLEKPFRPVAKVEAALKAKGIETRPFFTPLSELPFYKTREEFPASKFLGAHGLTLPSGASLKNDEIDFICNELKKTVGPS
ncbi:MAG: DegT/DnrJ/EryC1/StrS family aminotransferase [Candidatus Diapherotrites archaeon]|nr:DegT/DnrJ/EryC1/StrS family aminotransferase [Candidatus Diapherotrites archaeon]